MPMCFFQARLVGHVVYLFYTVTDSFLLCLLSIERSFLESLTVTLVSYIVPFSFCPFCFIYFDNVIKFAKYFCPL